MATSKTTDASLTGLVKQPNPYGDAPSGSLEVANNIQIKRKGVIEPRNSLAVSAFESPVDYYPAKMWPVEDQLLAVVRDGGFTGLSWLEEGADNAVTMSPSRADEAGNPGSTAITFLAGKAGMASVRERFILTDEMNPIVIDEVGATTARSAGMPMPFAVVASSYGAGDVLADNKWVGYKTVFVKWIEDEDTGKLYFYESAVSAPIAFENDTGASIIPSIEVYWDTTRTPVVAGDKIRVYRTKAVDSRDLIGDAYQLAIETVVTSGMVTAGASGIIRDFCVDDSLGRDLYVNEGQEGAEASHYMPPPSTAIATFKNVTFYASKASWQVLKAKTPYFWGLISSTANRANGFGVRLTGGSVTSGSPIMTGVPDAQAVGIQVGQRIATNGSFFPIGSIVLSVVDAGADYTITFDQNSGATSALASVYISDVISVNGEIIAAPSVSGFIQGLVSTTQLGDTPVVVLPSKAYQQHTTANPIPTEEGMEIVFTNPISGSPGFHIAATNGSNWTPPLPPLTDLFGLYSSDDRRTNRLYYSKVGLPECVATSAFEDVGNGDILNVVELQDKLLVAATDGTWEVTGQGHTWSISNLNDTVLISSDAVAIDDNTIYGWSQDGLVRMSPNGQVEKLSHPFIRDDIAALTVAYQDAEEDAFGWGAQITVDRFRNEVWFNFADLADSDEWLGTYIFNLNTGTFVQQTQRELLSVVYSPHYRSVIGAELDGTIYDYDTAAWMPVEVRFNPIAPADLGNWKQWLDATLHLEDLEATTFTPEWERIDGSSYSIAATSGSFEHVIALPRNYVYNKRTLFGFTTTAAYFRAMGISYRYRVASETLRR